MIKRALAYVAATAADPSFPVITDHEEREELEREGWDLSTPAKQAECLALRAFLNGFAAVLALTDQRLNRPLVGWIDCNYSCEVVYYGTPKDREEMAAAGACISHKKAHPALMVARGAEVRIADGGGYRGLWESQRG